MSLERSTLGAWGRRAWKTLGMVAAVGAVETVGSIYGVALVRAGGSASAGEAQKTPAGAGCCWQHRGPVRSLNWMMMMVARKTRWRSETKRNGKVAEECSGGRAKRQNNPICKIENSAVPVPTQPKSPSPVVRRSMMTMMLLL